MVIGFYIARLVGGGAELMNIQIANKLAARGHTVHLLIDTDPPDGNLFDIRVPVHKLCQSSTLGAARALSKTARALHIEVLVSALPVANLVVSISILFFRLDARVIDTWHGFFGSASGIRGTLSHLLCGVLSRVADYNVAVSDTLLHELLRFGAPRNRLVRIYNGVAPPSMLPPFVWDRPYILTAGSLTAHKNHELLIRSFADFRKAYDWSLIVAGQGPLRAHLHGIAEQLNIAHHVHFIGFQQDLSPYYSGARMFVLPSNVESFGLVLVEALACGIPVVSTASGGPAEILDNGTFGRLVRCGDQTALTRAMVDTVLDHPSAENLKARAALFSLDRAVSEYEELCRSVVAGA